MGNSNPPAKLDQVGFAADSRRWVVERLFTWIGCDRRIAKAFEAITKIQNSWTLTFIKLIGPH